MLDGRVLGASQVEYNLFGKPPLKKELIYTHLTRTAKENYSSRAYIDVGTGRIAFLWHKTVQRSYSCNGREE